VTPEHRRLLRESFAVMLIVLRLSAALAVHD
jgi:hypothetical protein